MLESICKYIQENDRNSDIMDFYKEVKEGKGDKEALVLCVTRILIDWKEDLEAVGMTDREKKFYRYLWIK